MKKKDLDENLLRQLYIDKKLTAYEIAEVLQVNRTTVVRYLKKYNIDINPKQRKYEIIKKIAFTQEQRDFLIGTLLGDGCVHQKGKSYYLYISHCEKQKDLVLWKKAILGNLVNVVNKIIDKRGNSIMYSFATVVHNNFNFFYKLFYENNKKVIKENLINYLTPLSLAVWIMDDGSLNKNVNLRFHTEGFSETEQKILQNILKIKFDIKSKICKFNRNNKEYYYLSLNKENTVKISKLVEKYFVQCMKYKLYTDSSTTACQTSV